MVSRELIGSTIKKARQPMLSSRKSYATHCSQ